MEGVEVGVGGAEVRMGEGEACGGAMVGAGRTGKLQARIARQSMKMDNQYGLLFMA